MPPIIKLTDGGTTYKVAEVLDQGGVAAVELEAPLSEIVVDMYRVEKAIFSSQGRRGGGSWKQLKPEVAKRKGSTKILRDTDALYDSLTRADAPYQILDVGISSITFGTDRPAAGVHQSGSPKAGIPARPFIKFLPTDVSKWTTILTKHLMRPFNRNL